jgi:hypothetical protein
MRSNGERSRSRIAAGDGQREMSGGRRAAGVEAGDGRRGGGGARWCRATAAALQGGGRSGMRAMREGYFFFFLRNMRGGYCRLLKVMRALRAHLLTPTGPRRLIC